jgi:hypothetical protein
LKMIGCGYIESWGCLEDENGRQHAGAVSCLPPCLLHAPAHHLIYLASFLLLTDLISCLRSQVSSCPASPRSISCLLIHVPRPPGLVSCFCLHSSVDSLRNSVFRPLSFAHISSPISPVPVCSPMSPAPCLVYPVS